MTALSASTRRLKDVSRSLGEKTRLMVSVLAGGRCCFCNDLLFEHHLTMKRGFFGENAHIVAFEEAGPRGGHPARPADPHALENLMLLCPRCHKLVDDDEVAYPVAFLVAKKKDHEERIRRVTDIAPNRRSTVLLYGANIGAQEAAIHPREAWAAMEPDWYPSNRDGLDISLKHSAASDHDPEFWKHEADQLRRKFERDVRPRLDDGTAGHLSIFAKAPQPLLVLLGSLLTDLRAAEVYQLHREPPGWRWPEHAGDDDVRFLVEEPAGDGRDVALVLGVSATVHDDRITRVLGDEVAIWRLTVPRPHNDVVKTRRDLSAFRQAARDALNRVKARHPAADRIHVFLVAPIAINIELGRVLMPKADLPLELYDEHRPTGGFRHALTIGSLSRGPSC